MVRIPNPPPSKRKPLDDKGGNRKPSSTQKTATAATAAAEAVVLADLSIRVHPIAATFRQCVKFSQSRSNSYPVVPLRWGWLGRPVGSFHSLRKQTSRMLT